ncbi:MAG: hypothetical protein IJ656_02190 [Bacilli bacterium]|nr:hypothetical protein [Bacilli bacterium]
MFRRKAFLNEFCRVFKEKPTYLMDTGGRLEIVGNHTDHNHGLCLVANCSLRIYCAINKNPLKVRIKSKGYKYFEFPVDDLEHNPNENSTTLAIVKGVLFKLKEEGYKIGGFDAYIESEIPDGSGVSSSAAIESLFGYLVSYLYNDGKIPSVTIAKIGQFSENVYFNKQCGMLDQIGTAFDSSNFIDFSNIKEPKVTTLPFNLPLSIFLVKSVGDHSNLTPLYNAIPSSMKAAAKLIDGSEVLMDVKVKDPYAAIDKIDLDDASKRKAKHFFNECANVLEAKKGIEENNVELFLDAVRKSQDSSNNNLENTYVRGEYEDSPQNIIDQVNEVLKDHGAVRIHGGGFKGTVIIFVKNEFKEEFKEFLSKTYPKNRFFEVKIPEKAVHFETL